VANSSVAVTPGSGANIDSHQIGSGDQQQIVRLAKVDTDNNNNWAVSTTAAAVISADENRVGVLVCNLSTVRVYLAFNNSASVTSSNADWYLDAGDRWEIPDPWVQAAISAVAATAGSGTCNFSLGTET
jgi:hypothetical protein